MTSRRRADLRADLDELAYELRRQGLSFRAIAVQLGVTERMARRRVVRQERREQGLPAVPSPPRSRTKET